MYVFLALVTLAAAMLLHLTAGAYLQMYYGLTGLGVDELLFAVLALLGGLAMVWYARREATPSGAEPSADIAEVFALRLPQPRQLLGGLLLIAGGYMGATLYSLAAENLFPALAEQTTDSMETVLAAPELSTLLLGAALVPAVCEELLFRGVTQYGFTRQALPGKPQNPGLGALMAATLFGVYHLSPLRIPLMILLGLLMGYALVKSGSILVPMLMHFCNNAAALVISWAAAHAQTAQILESGESLTISTAASLLPQLTFSCLLLLALGAALLEAHPRLAMEKHRGVVLAAAGIVVLMAVLAGI